MTWIRLRSRRDPAVWLPHLAVVLTCLAFAVWAHLQLSAWQEAIRDRAAADPQRALAEARDAVRWFELALGASSLIFGAFLFRLFQLGLRESRLPPSGGWSFGAWRALEGERARRASRFGMALVGLIVAAAALTIAIVESLLRTIAAG